MDDLGVTDNPNNTVQKQTQSADENVQKNRSSEFRASLLHFVPAYGRHRKQRGPPPINMMRFE